VFRKLEILVYGTVLRKFSARKILTGNMVHWKHTESGKYVVHYSAFLALKSKMYNCTVYGIWIVMVYGIWKYYGIRYQKYHGIRYLEYSTYGIFYT